MFTKTRQGDRGDGREIVANRKNPEQPPFYPTRNQQNGSHPRTPN